MGQAVLHQGVGQASKGSAQGLSRDETLQRCLLGREARSP